MGKMYVKYSVTDSNNGALTSIGLFSLSHNRESMTRDRYGMSLYCSNVTDDRNAMLREENCITHDGA